MLVHGDQAPRELSRDELLAQFTAGDLWVVNNTKVAPRRVFTDDGLEILFIRPLVDEHTWEVLCPSTRWKNGTHKLAGGVRLELVQRGRPQTLRADRSLTTEFFLAHGELPLPPYIQKSRGERHTRLRDASDYQSIWAQQLGSLAAPTASFHFDEEFVGALKARGVNIATVTLHVGLGTFLPVTAHELKDHVMHREWAEVPAETVRAIEATRKNRGRVIAVGTTVARTLESMALGLLQPVAGNGEQSGGFIGETGLLIQPGHSWREVDILLTNFHQPRSTLLALVASFAGLERVRAAYHWAIERHFRLFSYGDLTLWTARL